MSRLWDRILRDRSEASGTQEDGRAIRFGRARSSSSRPSPPPTSSATPRGCCSKSTRRRTSTTRSSTASSARWPRRTGATTVYYGTPWDDSTLLERAVQTNLELERRDGIRRHFSADWTAVADFNPALRPLRRRRTRAARREPPALPDAVRPQDDFRRRAAVQRLAAGAAPGDARAAERPASGRGLRRGARPRRAGLGRDENTKNEERTHDATVLTIARAVTPPSDAVVQEPRLEIVEHLAFSGDVARRLVRARGRPPRRSLARAARRRRRDGPRRDARAPAEPRGSAMTSCSR